MAEQHVDRESAFPLGRAVRIDELDRDPYPVLARLREPVSRVPALGMCSSPAAPTS